MIIASWWPEWPWLGSRAGQADNAIQRPPYPLRSPRPNYNRIHAQPLPINVYTLPLLVPHNPISVLHFVSTYLYQLLSQRPSHPKPLFRAYWSAETFSVHVTDEQTIRFLWEKGFFGKGSLSRSEPTWLEREKKRLGVTAVDTSEEYTRLRREERKQFKNERAKKAREAIEEKLRQESGITLVGDIAAPNGEALNKDEDDKEILAAQDPSTSRTPESQESLLAEDAASLALLSPKTTNDSNNHINPPTSPIPNREHLQLTPEEAFFLSYALGVLSIHPSPTSTTPLSNPNLLTLFRTRSYFPPLAPSRLTPSDPFLLSYITYHHFRSLGWVVRSGIKFGVDYLLYQRGPAFAHAQFSVVVVPTYGGRGQDGGGKQKNWWWLHAVNRVQSQVLKNLVICFVEVPSSVGEGEDITGLLGRYKVREMVIKRWTPNRTRD
jgi:tRNA-splicing endonuclease subunit Sen2